MIKQIIIAISLLILFSFFNCKQNPQVKNTEPDYSFTLKWRNNLDNTLPGWSFGDWSFDTNMCEFQPENAVFEKGLLKLSITPKDNPSPELPYWGAEYYSDKHYSYGKYSVSMKPVCTKGVIASFFLAYYEFNADYSKLIETSEIDIEFVGRTDKVQYALHWVDKNGKLNSKAIIKKLPFDASLDFHVYDIVKTPDYIAFYIDGELYHKFNDPEMIKEQANPQSVKMNYWVSTSPEWAGKFNPDVLPVETEYDYIEFYSLD